MCGKAERKVEFISDDYLMLLASTGQPSFYPQDTSDDEYENIKPKNEDNINNEIKSLNKLFKGCDCIEKINFIQFSRNNNKK